MIPSIVQHVLAGSDQQRQEEDKAKEPKTQNKQTSCFDLGCSYVCFPDYSIVRQRRKKEHQGRGRLVSRLVGLVEVADRVGRGGTLVAAATLDAVGVVVGRSVGGSADILARLVAGHDAHAAEASPVVRADLGRNGIEAAVKGTVVVLVHHAVVGELGAGLTFLAADGRGRGWGVVLALDADTGALLLEGGGGDLVLALDAAVSLLLERLGAGDGIVLTHGGTLDGGLLIGFRGDGTWTGAGGFVEAELLEESGNGVAGGALVGVPKEFGELLEVVL